MTEDPSKSSQSQAIAEQHIFFLTPHLIIHCILAFTTLYNISIGSSYATQGNLLSKWSSCSLSTTSSSSNSSPGPEQDEPITTEPTPQLANLENQVLQATILSLPQQLMSAQSTIVAQKKQLQQ
jgi:hypothetical protein